MSDCRDRRHYRSRRLRRPKVQVPAAGKLLRLVLLVVMQVSIAGCASINYGRELLVGHLSMLAQRQPIEVAIAHSVSRREQDRLLLAARARAFASVALGLPANRSYRTYARLQRRFVVWNVVAAPALSLEPVPACFFLIGCLPYRGFFSEANAQAEASRLERAGLDVYVGGVAAYSTLGWFDDPVLDTMLHWDDAQLVRVLFHELAHQVVFVSGDAEFNESFAEFVGGEGYRQWLEAEGDADAARRACREESRDVTLTRALLETRGRLAALYATRLTPEQKSAAKERIIGETRAWYQRLRRKSAEFAVYDGFMGGPLNNAQLAAVATYQRLVPAFAQLFDAAGRSWPRFYERVRELGRLSAEARREALASALRSSGSITRGCAAP